jgi:hypothetical protein
MSDRRRNRHGDRRGVDPEEPIVDDSEFLALPIESSGGLGFFS